MLHFPLMSGWSSVKVIPKKGDSPFYTKEVKWEKKDNLQEELNAACLFLEDRHNRYPLDPSRLSVEVVVLCNGREIQRKNFPQFPREENSDSSTVFSDWVVV